MVRIRLARGGAKKRPFYQIIVTDNHQARDGRFIERVGFFNPLATGQAVDLRLNMDRILYWINHGAKMSERLYALIKSAKNKSQYSSAG
ncbi:30S ribosomal protein S16 [Candidatus Palibaumannia cicadellinicola]|uniref:Small ribosomal subunit protein bS16 n=1 Tax=Baumannia cicadellinicola subsp. Homalodisca coagulata TaxID=374463 RepID=RS16_BAUCH|nr:30S ribosomal protein S16 [Candidatus Baumannia cicadellinicola]Q1LTQ9.1 RecName: Full=Small ribosomal subunit protein bS16; AltName: Full=30S ribosomal protein S16 [Baumannia cicadellinicola str. Hc (Homalodisca coagulata)]ABF14146.1 ribosomal protein S16 [Baumannia cicadellinicola str. Hc (Homalodisca coagulata)]MCJ7462361.1 30S ribosomal protein S16 [Candidatus Baumannia cicadellinicola]MCJ7462678.1 30S ribosomal protein S16 [Candidatus Baumannia cicadellinicola]